MSKYFKRFIFNCMHLCAGMCKSAGMQEQRQGWVSVMEGKGGKEVKIKYSKETLPKMERSGKTIFRNKLGKQ